MLKVGDWIDVETPGGGGYGKMAERAPEALAADREQDYFPE